MVHPQKEKIVSYLLLILLSGPRGGGALFDNMKLVHCNSEILNSEIREHE